MQQTLSIIKPDAVKKNVIGKIIDIFESNDLEINQMKKIKLSSENVAQFYAEHKNRPFFTNLKDYMTSGDVVIIVLEGENAIIKNRTLMGATNPKEAETGTIRQRFATDISQNAVHGSDSETSAKREIDFFFPKI
ncbi:MAG: Nucleoside diphosphate kinase (EC [uncultured Campylobacterales bacterium]|uniref:Nucleoside diphosphate kinase n=1 Tax=uncultured Campylobacterales bacterium TaxID=352960 RepID=A0A6S6SP97_9BACT|nr:MAG: Nucleoside diphosphate kinase (EC [uncultured Campylobacterales bacterium]